MSPPTVIRSQSTLKQVKKEDEGQIKMELELDPDGDRERVREAPGGPNERASVDFMLRMGAQASRLVIVPPASKMSETRDEILELPALQSLIRKIEGTVVRYFKPEATSAYGSVHDVSVRCIKSASKIYGEEAARKEAEGFEWDPVKLANDQAAFVAADCKITTMALTRQDEHRSTVVIIR